MPLTRNKLYPFTDESAKKAPNEAGAHELLEKDMVVYIGSTERSIQERIRLHKKRTDFMEVTHFRYRKVEWPDEAIELEAELCRLFKKAHNGDRPLRQHRTPVNRNIFDW
jgi:hypothetical protein